MKLIGTRHGFIDFSQNTALAAVGFPDRLAQSRDAHLLVDGRAERGFECFHGCSFRDDVDVRNQSLTRLEQPPIQAEPTP